MERARRGDRALDVPVGGGSLVGMDQRLEIGRASRASHSGQPAQASGAGREHHHLARKISGPDAERGGLFGEIEGGVGRRMRGRTAIAAIRKEPPGGAHAHGRGEYADN